MTIEYAGGRYAPRTAQGHIDAYRGLAEKAGVELRYVLELAAAGSLSPLFDKGSGRLRYFGSDPLRRSLNLAERLEARHQPRCGECGCRHAENHCRARVRHPGVELRRLAALRDRWESEP
jgi:hypothetical protein